MVKGKLVIWLLIGSLVVSGCATSGPGKKYLGPMEFTPEQLQKYGNHTPLDQGKFSQPILVKVYSDGIEEWHVTFQSPFHSNDAPAETEIKFFIPTEARRWKHQKLPLMVILPILNGQNTLERWFARYYGRRGYITAIINGAEKDIDLEQLDDINGAIRKLIAEQKIGLDYLCGLPEVDTTKVVLFGMSMGAIKATFLAALDDRVSGTAIILGGGNFPYLLSHSTLIQGSEDVEKFMEKNNLASMAELEQYLKENIQLDTIEVAPGIDAETVVMVMGKRDRTVPYETQVWLWETIGEPQAYKLPTGHLSSVLFIPYIQQAVYNFFEELFERQNETE